MKVDVFSRDILIISASGPENHLRNKFEEHAQPIEDCTENRDDDTSNGVFFGFLLLKCLVNNRKISVLWNLNHFWNLEMLLQIDKFLKTVCYVDLLIVIFKSLDSLFHGIFQLSTISFQSFQNFYDILHLPLESLENLSETLRIFGSCHEFRYLGNLAFLLLDKNRQR